MSSRGPVRYSLDVPLHQVAGIRGQPMGVLPFPLDVAADRVGQGHSGLLPRQDTGPSSAELLYSTTPSPPFTTQDMSGPGAVAAQHQDGGTPRSPQARSARSRTEPPCPESAGCHWFILLLECPPAAVRRPGERSADAGTPRTGIQVRFIRFAAGWTTCGTRAGSPPGRCRLPKAPLCFLPGSVPQLAEVAGALEPLGAGAALQGHRGAPRKRIQ